MSTRRLQTTQQQLLLDIGPEQAPPTLANFIVGDNTELFARLGALGDPGVFDQIYLWGPPGCGRSHLLRGTLAAAQAQGRPVCFVEAVNQLATRTDIGAYRRHARRVAFQHHQR